MCNLSGFFSFENGYLSLCLNCNKCCFASNQTNVIIKFTLVLYVEYDLNVQADTSVIGNNIDSQILSHLSCQLMIK